MRNVSSGKIGLTASLKHAKRLIKFEI